MAMNQTLYVLNPKESRSAIISSASASQLVVDNSTGTEPLKVTGLKIAFTSGNSIATSVTIGGQTLTATPATNTSGDFLDLLAATSIPTQVDSNGNRYLILQAGSTITIGRSGNSSPASSIFYSFDSYKA